MNEWATEPLALRRDRIRRLVAQEFVWRLAAIGSATREELRAFPLLLFKVPACPEEIDQVSEAPAGWGWVEKPEHDDGEWVFHGGRGRGEHRGRRPVARLRRPRRVDPVAGLREIQIIRVIRSWKRVQADDGYRPVRRLYGWSRLALIVVFDAAMVAAFTASLFGAWAEAVALGIVAAVTGGIHLTAWTWPVYKMAVKVRDGRLPPRCQDADAAPAGHSVRA